MDYLYEDLGVLDITTFGLDISNENGKIEFFPKDDIVLSGTQVVEKILKQTNLEYQFLYHDGAKLSKNSVFLKCSGKASDLHKIWKITQNIFEYSSGIATYTNQMVQIARKNNPKIIIATTRKNVPGSKEIMIQGVLNGGGVAHRLGLYDSILIFKEHLQFIPNQVVLEEKFAKLKTKFIEKKIAVEVHDYSQARYFASLGADILQCEKMDFETLQNCIDLKIQYPNLLISATGGININNIEHYSKYDVDFVVTSSPYHAKPSDIKVKFEA